MEKIKDIMKDILLINLLLVSIFIVSVLISFAFLANIFVGMIVFLITLETVVVGILIWGRIL